MIFKIQLWLLHFDMNNLQNIVYNYTIFTLPNSKNLFILNVIFLKYERSIIYQQYAYASRLESGGYYCWLAGPWAFKRTHAPLPVWAKHLVLLIVLATVCDSRVLIFRPCLDFKKTLSILTFTIHQLFTIRPLSQNTLFNMNYNIFWCYSVFHSI